MPTDDLTQITDGLFAAVRGYIQRSLDPLLGRVKALEAEVINLIGLEKAARSALKYLEDVGPMLDAGNEDSGCDLVANALREELYEDIDAALAEDAEDARQERLREEVAR